MNTSIVVLGSNIAPQKNIHQAKKLISLRFKILSETQWVKTKPIGITNQPDFINGAIFLQTELIEEEFRRQVKEIEHKIGRSPNSAHSYGPRVIDIDIIVWNNLVLNKDFYDRDFVRRLVLELVPTVQY